jgi:hypothetical protein
MDDTGVAPADRCYVDTWLPDSDARLFAWHCLTHNTDSRPSYPTRDEAIAAGKRHTQPPAPDPGR